MSGEDGLSDAPAAEAGVVITTDSDIQVKPSWAIEDPLETLLEMTRKGEIDPWNIDIIKVTDKFLVHLEQAYRFSLRMSGRALLYASILLRMKSDALIEVEEEDREEEPAWDVGTKLPLQPRVLHPARRPATLYELIEELRRAEKVKEHRTLRRVDRTRQQQQRPSVQDAMSAAHDKMLRVHAEELWIELQELFVSREFVGIAEMVTGDKLVEKYLPLLYLTHWRRVRLEQSVLFGELLIYPRNEDEGLDEENVEIPENDGGQGGNDG
jgi:segregation and condensation protein A